jgi:hypothetical protein
MNRLASRLAFALGLLALARPAAAEPPNTLSPAEQAAGWRLLFDGTSLTGWRSLKSPAPGAGWKVIDGAIVRTAESGDLVTADAFGDFDLSIEWKVEEATNSGILYRVDLGSDRTYESGPEYQILDNVKGGDRFQPSHRAGALYDLVAPPQDFTRPVGQWNLTRIRVRGWHVEHWLNGHKIVDVDLGTPEGRAMIAASKFRQWPQFATFRRGHIALQDHDHRVAFRDLRILELAPGS